MSTSSRDSCTSPALTFAVTSIWQRTFVSTTGSEGAPEIGVQVPGVVGTHVTLAMLTLAGVGICKVTAEKPQTLVNPTTVEQALTLTVPPVFWAAVMVSKPPALMEALAPNGSPDSDQVTVWLGLLLPMTAALSWSVVLPEAALTIEAWPGVTFT